ncbi:hypothetical protein H2203_001405 [Taxawa tesnikishii (nom. ined.)]|nr:hypothetical protein H2203_001405 [Dothideales sp. JES 119]
MAAIPEVVVPEGEGTPGTGDVKMQDTAETGAAQNGDDAGEAEPSGLEDIEVDEEPAPTSFLDYLRSPIVELTIGTGDEAVTLSAHQALLVQSPFFRDACAQFSSDAALANPRIRPRHPLPDDDGLALLRHARVYTHAQRFGMPALAGLAHKKIHLTNSTARGEIAYARYVYRETSADDTAIRKPVASFWATRSHVLRHEAEEEFRRMCLEFPQFGFDVLSLVLDAQERRSQRAAEGVSVGGGRKRPRMSQG